MKAIDDTRRGVLKGAGLLALSPLYANSLFAKQNSKTLMLVSANKELKSISLPPRDYTLELNMIANYHSYLKKINTYISSKKVDSVVGVLSWADYLLLSQAIANSDVRLKSTISDEISSGGQVFKLVSFTCKMKKEKNYV